MHQSRSTRTWVCCAKFSAWRMGGLVRAYRVTYDVKANWKLMIQNYSECLHCPIIHPALQRLSHYMTGDNDPADELVARREHAAA